MDSLRQIRRRLWRAVKRQLPRLTGPRISKVLPRIYLQGRGIEIGALHNPQTVPNGVTVHFVDRMPNNELLRQYPELQGQPLVPISMVVDGERLTGIADQSQDFVIASHFLEHCQDPIGTLKQFFRVLKPNGIAFLKIPDKRYTFDRFRPLTTLEHLLADHAGGAEQSRRAHYEEYAKFVHHANSQTEIAHQADALLARNFSIHYHVWTQREILELLLHLQVELRFEIESFCKHRHEVICVLRKANLEPVPLHVARPVGFQQMRIDAA